MARPSNRLRSKPVWVNLLLILILLLGAFLRFHELGEESLWNDELESWRQSSFGSIAAVIEHGVQPDTHPPAFQIVLFVVERYLGTSEALLRLPSAVSGTLSILVVFFLGRKYFKDSVGLMAAMLMAVTWAPIYYSQEARNYAMVMLFSLVASYFWMDLVSAVENDEPVRGPTYLAYIAGAALSAYTHYFGLLLIALQSVYLLVLAAFRRRKVYSMLVMVAAIGALYAPWIPSMIEQSTHTARISWIQPPTLRAYPAFISFAFNRLEWFGLIVIGLYLWLGLDRINAARKSTRLSVSSLLTSPEGLLAYWLAAPLTVAFLISVLWTPILTQRNLLICLPAVYLLAACAIESLPMPRFGRTALALGFGMVALYNLVFSMGYYRFDQKEQFREAVEYVIERTSAAHDTPIIGYSRFPEYFDYYFRSMGSDLRVDLSAGENADVQRLQAFLEQKEPDRLWFISAHRSPDDRFLEALGDRYDVIDHRAFFMAEVRLLARRQE